MAMWQFEIPLEAKWSIGIRAFRESISLTGTLLLTGAFTSIGERAFSETGLEKVIVDDSFDLTKIPTQVFSDCFNLASFELKAPLNALHFECGSFDGCPNLHYFSCVFNSRFDIDDAGRSFFDGTNNIEIVRFFGNSADGNDVLTMFSDQVQFPGMKQFIVPCDAIITVRNQINVTHIHDNGMSCFETILFIRTHRSPKKILSVFILFQ